MSKKALVLASLTLLLVTPLPAQEPSHGLSVSATETESGCDIQIAAGSSFRLERITPADLSITLRSTTAKSEQPALGSRCVEWLHVVPVPGEQAVRLDFRTPPDAFRSIRQEGGSLTLSLALPEVGAPGDSTLYRIGVDDILTVTVADHPNLSKEVTVDRNGSIALEFVGRVPVAGMTSLAASETIAALLNRSYVVDPQVTVIVKEPRSQFVLVEGQVRKPGKFYLRGRTNLKEILADAGGFEMDAGYEVIVSRPAHEDGEPEEFRLTRRLMDAGQAKLFLKAGDVISVPQRSYIFVGGEVQAPDRYPYEPGMTLLQAIVMAKDLKEWANPKEVRLIRTAGGEQSSQTYDLRAIQKMKAPNVPLQPGDQIVVYKRLL